MYQIKSNNNFFLSNLEKLLSQRNFPFIKNENFNSYGLLEFEILKDHLNIKFNNIKISTKVPINLANLWSSLDVLLSNHKINFGRLSYYPMKEQLNLKENFLKLTHTHNLIIQEILHSKENKISKINIYKKIWPGDVNIQINKLDTHLTNLKNILFEKFNYELKFYSTSGIITFSIN